MSSSLAAAYRMATNPARFAEAVGFERLDDWQRRLLCSQAPRILLLASRQAGKSAICAVIAAHQALYVPGSLTLCVAPTLRQSSELFRKVLDCYRAAGKPVDAEAESKLSLELTSGSRVVALPGREGTVRGYSGASLLLLDEAARIPDELLASVRPMLAVSAGRLIALTSAWGKRGWLYDAYVSSDAYERYKVPATECPRIPADFLAEEERVLGPLIYASEYLCEFTDPEGSIFRSDLVDQCFKEYPVWNLDKYLTFGTTK